MGFEHISSTCKFSGLIIVAICGIKKKKELRQK